MSCGNPAVESESIMPRALLHSLFSMQKSITSSPGRKKYDKTKHCVRCKETQGSIVIRHAVYCKYASEISAQTGRLISSCQRLLFPSHHPQVQKRARAVRKSQGRRFSAHRTQARWQPASRILWRPRLDCPPRPRPQMLCQHGRIDDALGRRQAASAAREGVEAGDGLLCGDM